MRGCIPHLPVSCAIFPQSRARLRHRTGVKRPLVQIDPDILSLHRAVSSRGLERVGVDTGIIRSRESGDSPFIRSDWNAECFSSRRLECGVLQQPQIGMRRPQQPHIGMRSLQQRRLAGMRVFNSRIYERAIRLKAHNRRGSSRCPSHTLHAGLTNRSCIHGKVHPARDTGALSLQGSLSANRRYSSDGRPKLSSSAMS